MARFDDVYCELDDESLVKVTSSGLSNDKVKREWDEGVSLITTSSSWLRNVHD